ncbi:hypothetical protein SNE40_004989 [Patella caerulea]|uniref:Death domain-containing protein n=1 Tax=Patella caerulea TaxID=87958 RepID=A0AAN8JZ69_PATCE
MTEQNETQENLFNFFSLPCSPREKTPEILVRFQAVSASHPCILQKSLSLNSELTLLEVRQILHPLFSTCYQRGFIFLWKQKEIGRTRERVLTLFDILPKPPRGVPDSQPFLFSEVQYRKLPHKKNGKRETVTCAGLVFLYEDSGVNQWCKSDLQDGLKGEYLYGFSFIPTSVTSSISRIVDLDVGRINQFAAMGNLPELQMMFNKLPHDRDLSDIYDERLASPLHYSCANGHLDVCEFLVGRLGRSVIYKTDINLNTPLHCALRRGHMDIVLYLLQLLPDLKSCDILGQSCGHLLFSLDDKKTDVLLTMVDSCACILDDKTVLHLTCLSIQKKNLSVARKLCKLLKVFPPSFYKPPLHLAAELGDTEMVDSLVNRPSDTEDAGNETHQPLDHDLDGHLPLHYASQHGHSHIIPLLYKPEITDDDFGKAVKLAITWHQYDALCTLFKLRPDFDIGKDQKRNLVFKAENNMAQFGKPIIQALNSEKNLLTRLVRQAAHDNLMEELELLESFGVEVSRQDYMGRTALHEAAEQGHADVVYFLLDHGADANVQDWQGSTALHYACKTGNTKVIDILVSHPETNINAQDLCGRNVLMVAAYARKSDVVGYLLQNSNVNPWQKDKFNQNILHYLILLDKASVILEILQCIPMDVSDINLNKSSEYPDAEKHSSEKSRRGPIVYPKLTHCECDTCGKKWHYFAWHSKSTHLCKPQSTISKGTVRTVQYGTQEAGIAEIEVISQPFQYSPCQSDILSLIEMHIVSDKTHYLQQLFDIIAKRLTGGDILYLCALAVKYWSIEALVVLGGYLDMTELVLSDLLRMSILMESATDEMIKKKLAMVKYLLQLGACPNYFHNLSVESQHIPNADTLHAESFNDYGGLPNKYYLKYTTNNNSLNEKLRLTNKEKRNVFLTPLELAVLQDNQDLVELLLFKDASVRLCFAVHLAVMGGKVQLIELLLKQWDQEKDAYVVGCDDVEAMHRACSLTSGILQAFCVSESACLQTLKILLTFLPDLLKSGKLLTATMVESVRPHLLNNTHTQLQKFLYRSASADHLQVLPITKLVQRKHNYDSLDDLSNLVIFMMKEGIHLSTVRVTKSGELHAACELFVEATEKSLWSVIEQLLDVSGDIVCKCLLAESSSCRRHVYDCLLDDDNALCASAVRQFLIKAPLSCLRVFYAHARSCVSADTSVTCSMDDIIQLSLTAVSEQRDGLLACCKILLLFPQILTKILSIMNPRRKRIWFQRKLSEVKSETMRCYKSTSKIINYIHNRLPDVILMKTLTSLPRCGIKNILDKQFTVAHVGCMLGNLNIVRMCFNGIIPSRVEIRDGDKPSLLDAAAAFGHRHIIGYLLDEGATTRAQTLVAACVGPEYIGMEAWRNGMTSSELSVEEERLSIIQLLHKRSNFSKAYGRNTYVSLLKAAVSQFYWSIAGWCLEYLGEADISFQNQRDALMSVFCKGPEQLCLNILETLPDSWWSDLSAEEAYDVIYTSTIRNDDVSAHLLSSLTQSYSFALPNVLSIKDKHKRNLLHFFCAQGRQDIIRKVLSQLTNCDFSRVDTILNSSDSSKATPLWYALAWHRWDICEMLVLNGAVIHKTRSFPLLCTRKMFRVEKQVSKTAIPDSKGGVYRAQCQRNKSFDAACVLGSSGPFFDQLYRSTTNVNTTFTDKATIISIDKTDNEIKSLNNTGSFPNLQYLLKLMFQALDKNASIFHIAVGTGDAALISSILEQPLFRYCTQKSQISPMTFALVNNRADFVSVCGEPGICHDFKNIVIYHALASINLTSVVKTTEKTAKRYQWNTSTITPLRLQLEDLVSIEKAVRSLSFFPTRDNPQRISVKILLNLIQENTSAHDDFLSTSFLLAAVISGQSWCFDVINSVCKSKAYYASIILRPLVAGFNMIDLLFLFAPADKTSVHGKKDIGARIQCLERLVDYHLDIALHQQTLEIIKDKRIFNMVVPMLKAGALTREQKDDELWFALVTEAASLGYTEYVILTCNEYINESNFTPVFQRLICISALRKYQDMFSKLLEYNERLDFLQPVEHVCKQTGGKSLSIFECAVISGVVSMVTDIINRLQNNGRVDMSSLRPCLEFAYARGNKKVCELLEKFTMSVSRNIMSIDFCLKLFSIAVRRGNGAVCISLLHSWNLNVVNASVSGMNNLDFACMYGMKTVVDEMLQDVQTSVVNSVNEDKMNALDYSRAFGHIELSTDLVETYRARSFQDSRTLVHYGWLSYCLRQNETCAQKNNPKHLYIKRKRRPLTLNTLIRLGDDCGAVSFIKAAPETVVSNLEQNYKKHPLLHLCSRYNCPETLKLLFESFQKYSVDKLESWSLLEYKGRNALAVAVECNLVNVAKILNTADAFEWRYRNAETILHWVARYGSFEMAEVLTDNISSVVLTLKDQCGLTPAATSVACGNQHILHLLLPKDNFEGSCHGDHKKTVFDCVECLLDFCIGWFKHAQTGRQIHPQILNRNMRHRFETAVGFRVHKKEAKIVYSHPLEKLLTWAQWSKSDILIQKALNSMGYPAHTVLAKMFLFRSKLEDDASVMSIALRENLTDVAIHILKNGYQCNTGHLSEMIVNAVGQHMNEFVNTLLELQYPVLTAQNAVGCSVLDAAYAMGNHTMIELFESKMEPDERSSHLSMLPQIMDHVSTLIRCQIKPGVHLINEFRPRTVGLSIFDMYRILPQRIMTEFFNDLNMINNGLMLVPVKLFNKDVFIDSESIRESVAKLKTTKQNVMSIILSKLVLGRYPKRMYKSWGRFEQVVVECLPKDSPEDASLAVVDGILRDRIKIQWNEATQKSTVETADAVSSVTDDSRHINIINDIMIPKLNEQIKMYLPNLRLEVRMDWSSIDNIHNIEERESVVKALVTESSTNPLSRLTEAAATCGQLLQDISLMLNKASTQSVISIFKRVSCITFQYAPGEDVPENFNLDPSDTLYWKFYLKKSGSRFPLLTILEVYHSACVGILDGFLKLSRSPRCVKTNKSQVSKAKNKKNKMKLNIDWQSFSKTQNAADLLTLFRQCVTLHISRMGATYDALPYLDLEIDELFITTAPAPDRAGLEYNHNILTVMIYIYKPNEGTWMTTEIDFKSKLVELQAEQLIADWSTRIGLQGRRRQFVKAVESLQTSIGVDVSVNYPENELLSFISAQKYMEMATPFKQMHYELRHFTSVIRDSFGKELTAYLEYSNCFWNLGKCDAKAGKWCWITPSEIDSVPSFIQLLVLTRTKGNKIVPKTFTMDTLRKLIKVKSVLIWIHMDSFPSNLNGNWDERFQIVIVKRQLFFVSDAEKALNIFDRLPKTFGYPFSQEDSDLVITTYSALSDTIFIKDTYANQSHKLTNTLYYHWWLNMAQQGRKLTLEGTDIESLNELDVLEMRDILSDCDSYIKKNISSRGSVIVRVDSGTSGKDASVGHDIQTTPEGDVCINVFKRKENEIVADTEVSTDSTPAGLLADYDDCDVPIQNIETNDDERLNLRIKRKTRRKNMPVVSRIEQKLSKNKKVLERVTSKLLDVAGMGSTGVIHRLLDVGANINAIDLNGCTPLILAAKSSHYVVEKLLLSRGADVNIVDERRRSALHYEAAEGNFDSVLLLVTYGAKVDAKDKLGWTPLRYAINNSHITTADMLVFCGADGTILDKKKESPIHVCDDPATLRLMKEGAKTIYGLKHGLVTTEFAILEAGKSKNLSKISLTVSIPSSLGTGAIYFICRRVQPEYCRPSLKPTAKEWFLSDVFEYRWTGIHFKDYITVSIPAYSKADVFDDVYLKTDKGICEECSVEYKQDGDELICSFKIRLVDMTAFVLVARPKTDRFLLTPEGRKFTSAIDHLVEVDVGPGAVHQNGYLYLEVIPKPEVNEKELGNVLSFSHFYQLSHAENLQLASDLKVTLPLPIDYFGNGDLYVLTSTVEKVGSEEVITCRITQSNPITTGGVVTFMLPVSQFICCNLLEWCNKPDDMSLDREQSVINTNIKLLQKARRRGYSAVFMTLVKPAAADHGAETVVECARNNNVYSRLRHWESQGFKSQVPTFTKEVCVYPEQEFKLDIEGNVSKVGQTEPRLQFHPYRMNFHKMRVSVNDPEKEQRGWVDVRTQRLKSLRKKKALPPGAPLAKMMIDLLINKPNQAEVKAKWNIFRQAEISKASSSETHRPAMSEASSSETPTIPRTSSPGTGCPARTDYPEDKTHTPFKGFMTDSLMTKLSRKIHSDWKKMGLYLGLTSEAIKKIMDGAGPRDFSRDNSFKMFTVWRKTRRHQNDEGLQELLVAVKLLGKPVLLDIIMNSIKSWLEETEDRQNKFHSWLMIFNYAAGSTTTLQK